MQPEIHQLRDAEIRIFNADEESPESDMYVLDVFGVNVIVRRRNGGETYVHVEDEYIVEEHRPLVVEVNNGGDVVYT